MNLNLAGKVVVVTGAARGIGSSIALEFAKEGAKVVVNDVIEGIPVVEKIRSMDGASIFFKADVSNVEDVEKLFSQVLEVFGRVDILVNNAGVTRDALIHKMKVEDWDIVMDVNLKGAFLCSKMASEHMMRRSYGRIINISSVVGQMGNVGQSNYASSKAGLIGLTKALALELAPYGITVNAIAPGFTKTEMTRKMPEKIAKRFVERIPLGRMAEPEEIAYLTVFLASDLAKYITGQVIAVNGGLYM
ncbi:MAG: 3-oxoacyl-[acyl-carrier-protein] reductase [Candidatus Bathyarchaeia archaeon]